MAAKNDILRDKDGNQIFPATMAEQVSYDGKINVKQAIKRGAVRNKVAPTVASMTDKEQIYVYTGTEDGYTFGNWYYWDGTAWTSGGAYNAIEVNTDGTLTEEGAPADAKATGDKLSELKDDLSEYESIFTGNVDESVRAWLDEHPEATTTVQDGSLTYKKLVTGTFGFVTPEMFGAKGDGVTDDTEAIQNAFDFGSSIRFDGSKTYLINSAIHVNEGNDIDFNNCTIICAGSDGLDVSMPSGSQKHNMLPIYIRNLNIQGNGSNTLIYWNNVLKSTIENIRFYNFGIGFDFVSGYETYGNNLRFIGSNPTCIGMRSNGSDSYFYNLIMRDCHIGLHIQNGSNKYYNYHAWIYNPDYYEGSCMVLDESLGGTRQDFYNPYFDTYHYCYKRTGLSTVFLHQPLLYNNYNVTDRTSIETAYFLHLTYSDSDKPYANRIYVEELVTQLGLSRQIYEICNKTDLVFRLTYVIANQVTINKINALSVYDIYNEVSINDITDEFITLNSGFSLVDSKVYKQGKHIFGNIIIYYPSGYVQDGLENAGTLKYRPTMAVNNGCFVSASEWSVDGYGYLYMDTSLSVKVSVSGMTYAKINVDYVCR